MSIKNKRAQSMSKIGKFSSTYAAISGFIPDDIWQKLSSREISSLTNAMWDLAQNSKALEVKQILENGGIWDDDIQSFRELSPKNKAAA